MGVCRMTRANHPLRPFVMADAPALRELFAQSIYELTAEDYEEEQRIAWAATAADGAAFAKKLAGLTTLVVEQGGEYFGFASLKDNTVIEMLYVHPWHAGEGIGSTLADALEKIATGRGAEALTVESSETAVAFFEGRGYVQERRNSISHDDEVWLTTTTMKKQLKAPQGKALS